MVRRRLWLWGTFLYLIQEQCNGYTGVLLEWSLLSESWSQRNVKPWELEPQEKLIVIHVNQKWRCTLAGVAQLVGASSCKLEGCRFDSRSGHMPRLQVWSPVGARTRGNRSMFLSHIDVFLPLSFSLPSLLKSISMSSGEDFRKAKGSVKLCVGPKVVWSLWVRFQGGMQCWVPSRPQVPREWKHWSWWVPRHLSSAIFMPSTCIPSRISVSFLFWFTFFLVESMLDLSGKSVP